MGILGKAYKDALWAAITATNWTQFDDVMKSIETINLGMHKCLGEIDLVLWSRHAFSLGCKRIYF